MDSAEKMQSGLRGEKQKKADERSRGNRRWNEKTRKGEETNNKYKYKKNALSTEWGKVGN